MEPIQVILGFFHLLATVIWIGGMAFNIFVLHPFLCAVDLNQRLNLVTKILQRFIHIAWLCIVTLFLTGFFIVTPSTTNYQMILTMKHIVVVVMVVIVAIISFQLFPKFKTQISKSGANNEISKTLSKIGTLVKLNLTLGILALLITSILE